MRIYLLNPPYLPHFGRGARWQDTGRGGTLYYPIWLSYATALLGQDHEVRLVDAPARGWEMDLVLADVGGFRPDLLVLDSSFPSLKNDIGKAEQVKKEHPGITVVLVGPPASQYAGEILQSPGIDIVARWEYDFTLRDLAQALTDGRDLSAVNGISYRAGGEVRHNPDRGFSTSEDLDTIPFVSKVYREYLRMEDYFLGQSLYPEVQIFTGRGCPNQCTFCAWPQTLTGRKYRVRSIENVLDELAYIEANLGAREVFFEDDTFTIRRERVLAFCTGYRERGLRIAWSCNARVNTLDLPTMEAMKKANCRLLVSGYESGVDSILRAILKGITTGEIREFARNARRAGLLVHGDFVIGLPGETRETIGQTRRFIHEVKPDILQVSVASPFPGTEFYTWCRDRGHLLTEDTSGYLDGAGHQKGIISYPGLTSGEMEQEAKAILREYYLSPRYVPLALRQVLRRNALAELRRLWHSARMFLQYAGP